MVTPFELDSSSAEGERPACGTFAPVEQVGRPADDVNGAAASIARRRIAPVRSLAGDEILERLERTDGMRDAVELMHNAEGGGTRL